jgi:hypothetical protein
LVVQSVDDRRLDPVGVSAVVGCDQDLVDVVGAQLIGECCEWVDRVTDGAARANALCGGPCEYRCEALPCFRSFCIDGRS